MGHKKGKKRVEKGLKLEKWVTLVKMGHISKYRVKLSKVGQTCKNKLL